VRRAFELRPYPVPTLDPGGEYLTRAWSQVVYPMAKRMGMTLHLPPVQPRTGLAHSAAFFAATQDRLEAIHEEIFRAFFERGEDIGSIDVLLSLGRKVGLDEGSLRQALEAREFEAQVLADQERAERLGVRAVPAFVVAGPRMLTGVRRFEELRELVKGSGYSAE
jgi:predicted DsbA family dithiol-disulfide isomerase